jgi:hypothetical protein
VIETVIIRHISGDYIVGAIHVGGRLHEATLRLPGVFGWSPLLTITGAEATPGNQTGGVISIQPSCCRATAYGSSSATPTEAISE